MGERSPGPHFPGRGTGKWRGERAFHRTDAAGVITIRTHDSLGRLLAISYGGTVSATYRYDALGRRVRMDDRTGQTAYAYDALGRTL